MRPSKFAQEIITSIGPEDAMTYATYLTLAAIRHLPLKSQGAAIASISAGAATLMQDAEWSRLRNAVGPCENPGCDCHVRTKAFLDAVDKIRETHKVSGEEARSKN